MLDLSEVDEMSRIVTAAMIDVDNIRLGKINMVDISKHLEPLLSWLCNVSQVLGEGAKDYHLIQVSWYNGEFSIVSQALEYQYRAGDDGTVGTVFPKLRAELTSKLCILQAICLDPSGIFAGNDIEELLKFCVALSQSFGDHKELLIQQLAF